MLVLQRNSLTESNIDTLIVASITSNLAHEHLPGNVRVSPRESGLDRPSVVNLTQVTTLDRRYLERRVGFLDQHAMGRVDTALRMVLGL